MTTPYHIAIAGSTPHTVMCAKALLADSGFVVDWVLTPQPRPTGRQKTVTQNALHHFAEEQNIPVVLLDKKIDESIKEKLTAVDFLLVVDFGYIIPPWLLQLPRLAPLNVHPSALPRWRGSSPGQFVLLSGEERSAITLMKMDEGVDTGPIIYQEFFAVQPTWTAMEYYQHSFSLIGKVLAEKIRNFAEKKSTLLPQPKASPTPAARRLSKEDGFVAWKVFETAMAGKTAEDQKTNELISTVSQFPLPQTLVNAARAFWPWPTLWTLISTSKGEKRMQIVKAHVENQKLVLDKVKIEGQSEAHWNNVKNILTSLVS